MSYDLSLCDAITGKTLLLDSPHDMRGGTYCLGGSNEASLNISYNYSRHYKRVFGHEDIELSDFQKIFGGGETGVRSLYGKTGAESIPILKSAVDQLGDDVSDNYWEATEGNAKRALIQLLALAQMRPDGIWKGD